MCHFARSRLISLPRDVVSADDWPAHTEIVQKLDTACQTLAQKLQNHKKAAKKRRDLVLQRLECVDEAAWDFRFSENEEPRRRCLEGTRVEILQEVEQWAKDAGGETIFWLRGMAGT